MVSDNFVLAFFAFIQSHIVKELTKVSDNQMLAAKDHRFHPTGYISIYIDRDFEMKLESQGNNNYNETRSSTIVEVLTVCTQFVAKFE